MATAILREPSVMCGKQGVPLESFKVKDADGRSIAAYRFLPTAHVHHGKIGGRKAFPKRLKEALRKHNNSKCDLCQEAYDNSYLQVDHRVPYEVLGDIQHSDPLAAYMLLCGSCNRAKSWACEHCENWRELKDADICRACYWANPADYQHLAMQQLRRVELVWTEQDIEIYQQLIERAQGGSLQLFLKTILANHLRKPD